MATKSVLLGQGATKSIPLSALTGQEGWISLTGDRACQTTAYYYSRVPWLYAGTNLIANATGSLPLRWVQANGEELEDENAHDWMQSFGDLLNALAGDMVLYGAAYVFLGRTARGRATTMRRMNPSSITPTIDAAAGLTGFKRHTGATVIELTARDLAYCWQPNRTGEIGPGTAPAQAALAAAGALANIDMTAALLFENGAIRPTLLTFDGLVQDAERQRVQGWLDRAVSGVKNAFRPLAVGTTITATTLGESPDNLSMPELTDSKRQDVATALGVPQTMLFSNAANFATAQQDAYQFYDVTIIPLVKRLLSALNDQVLGEYGITAETAEAELELYQRANETQVTAMSVMFDRRAITVNEFRQRVGFAPLEDPAMPEADEQADEPDADEQAPEDDLQALPEPQDNQADTQRAELRTWERFVMKRLRDGKPVRPFKAEYLPAVTVAAIEGQIEGAADIGAVKAAFEDAGRWIGYP